MLQLFASPAGRALLSNDNRPRGSTSTSSLSRESSSRLKSGRRPSGTGTVSAPTSPPRQRKSSAELYKEAVEILGLTCSLTDSCRCIDCQVILPPVFLRFSSGFPALVSPEYAEFRYAFRLYGFNLREVNRFLYH